MNSAQSYSYLGGLSMIYEKSTIKYWLIGVYLPVIALKAYWDTTPPKNALIEPKLPSQM